MTRAPGSVSEALVDRVAASRDASHFVLVPSAVATPGSVADVRLLLAAARAGGPPLTFRSGGTSLSGQSQTDGVLVDTRRHFQGVEVLEGGALVRVQPGVTVRQVNTRLAPYGRRIGPDPASEGACTLGGVVANNSSGMTCGTEHNAYATLDSLTFVLPSGTLVDTAAPDADALFRQAEPELADGLLRLREQLLAAPEELARVRRLFSIKNTMGYGLNALVDHETPVQVLAHLLVGSEGTLAFVAGCVLRTVPARRAGVTSLLVFPGTQQAVEAVEGLCASGPTALELLDGRSLAVARRDPSTPDELRSVARGDEAALLVEWSLDDGDGDGDGDGEDGDRAGLEARVAATLRGVDGLVAATTTTETALRGRLWRVRKGLYASVAGARTPGTTALLEDVAVPRARLAQACAELDGLFRRHRYDDVVVFGHARDGNIHFMLSEDFGRPAGRARYEAFTEDMVDVVLGCGGTLKAEHGTGRMMADYVPRQYGPFLHGLMVQIKRLCDPDGVLSPGVLVADRPGAHLRDLKTTEPTDPEVDRCVDCGFCEPTCPSRDLTTTPRQRIAVRRATAAATRAGDLAGAGELAEAFRYEGLDTCAVDGLCELACPVGINTGDLVKRLRGEAHGRGASAAGAAAARHWRHVTRAASASMTAAAAVPVAAEGVTSAARRLTRSTAVPLWTRGLPSGAGPARPVTDPAARVLYLPSCLGSVFGPAGDDGPGVVEAFTALVGRAGVAVRTLADPAGVCCGTPWRSKGLERGYDTMRRTVQGRLAGDGLADVGTIVVDATSCTEGLRQLLGDAPLAGSPGGPPPRVVDATTFVLRSVMPRLTVRRRVASLTLHPTCSSARLGVDGDLRELAGLLAEQVVVPDAAGCCGFAGDRGFFHPELTAAATAPEAADVAARPTQVYASANRTCEIGMQRATGQAYEHLVQVAERVTRPA